MFFVKTNQLLMFEKWLVFIVSIGNKQISFVDKMPTFKFHHILLLESALDFRWLKWS